jgi:hypothetical protein
MLISILISTLDVRVSDHRFFTKIMNKLTSQVGENDLGNKVEIIVFCDDRILKIGTKRNFLISKAQGKFLCFVDDDDDISDTYVMDILEIIEQDAHVDYIGWKQMYIENGRIPDKLTYHSIQHKCWWQDDKGWYRHVSHLNPVSSSIAKTVEFRDINNEEDLGWADLIHPLLKTEAFIDKVMYYYHYNTSTTLSRTHHNIINYKKDEEPLMVLEKFKNDFVRIYYNQVIELH